MNRITKFITMGTLLILMLGMLTACGKKKIDVSETLTLHFSGSNEYGIAEIENAYDWVEEAFKEAGIEDIDSFSALGDGLTIESAVSYEVYPKDNLSNGDEVTVKATFDNETVEKYNIEFKASERKFIVDGLPEIEQVDLFENIEISYQGIAPDVTAAIVDTGTDSYVSTSYSLDKSNSLDVGDIITVTATYNKERLLESGYKVESDTKEFEVPNVARYITKISDIPEDLMNKMKKQTEDSIHAQIASYWDNPDTLNGVNFMGNYLLTLKSGMFGLGHNVVYMIYRIDVANAEDNFSYYTYCSFRDVILLEDGTCSVDLSDYTTPSRYGESFNKGKLYYIGYEQLESLFNKCVTSNIESYEYETNITE